MQFDHIIGQEHLKKHIKTSYQNNRMPHAQLYIGENGHGTLAMALACADLILNSKGDIEVVQTPMDYSNDDVDSNYLR